MPFARSIFAIALVLGSFCAIGGRRAGAEELPPPERPIEEVVDSLVNAGIAAAGKTAAPPVDDSEFVRRVTLDLAGRIPSVPEVRSYVESAEPDKKARLVDRLLSSPDFAYHVRNEYDALLMAGKGEGEWRDWLLKAFQEDRRWPQLFREIMLPREDQPELKAAVQF